MALNGLILVAFKGFFLTPMDERDVAEVQSSQGEIPAHCWYKAVSLPSSFLVF